MGVFLSSTSSTSQEAHAKELELELRRGVDQLSKEHKKLTEPKTGWDFLGFLGRPYIWILEISGFADISLMCFFFK